MAKDIDTPPKVTVPSGNTGTKIVIGCKLAHGLAIDAPTSRIVNPNGELVDSGERDLSSRVFLNGTNTVTNTGTGIIDPASGGYGITVLTGEDAEMFQDWYARHRDYAPVKNGLIFPVPSEDDAAKEGKSRASVKNGAERLDPEKPVVGGVQKFAADEK